MTTRLFSVILVLLCAVAVFQVSVIPASPMFSVVDATFVPAVVSGLLAISVLVYAIRSFLSKSPDATADEEQKPLSGASRRTLFFLCGLLACLIGMKPLGFVIATTLAGLGIARSFDAPLNAKALGLVLSTSIFFWILFDRLLSVNLGPLVVPLWQGLS